MATNVMAGTRKMLLPLKRDSCSKKRDSCRPCRVLPQTEYEQHKRTRVQRSVLIVVLVCAIRPGCPVKRSKYASYRIGGRWDQARSEPAPCRSSGRRAAWGGLLYFANRPHNVPHKVPYMVTCDLVATAKAPTTGHDAVAHWLPTGKLRGGLFKISQDGSRRRGQSACSLFAPSWYVLQDRAISSPRCAWPDASRRSGASLQLLSSWR